MESCSDGVGAPQRAVEVATSENAPPRFHNVGAIWVVRGTAGGSNREEDRGSAGQKTKTEGGAKGRKRPA